MHANIFCHVLKYFSDIEVITHQNPIMECFFFTFFLQTMLLFSLLLNGCVALMQERYEEAETFFEDATSIDEKSILAWTTLGQRLLYALFN